MIWEAVRNNATNKRTDFSVWNSIVNDRIKQFEELDTKYRIRGKQIEEKLKEDIDDILVKYESVKKELDIKGIQIQKLEREKEELKQYIINMENSSSWKMTRPIRWVFDTIRK